MNDAPLISIIIPVYNVENFLIKCVLSIINQTYKNTEIILIDDGSTDNSSLICDYFKKIDDRIVVVHKKNGGLSSARNAGLDICHGDYIAFVDSDDYVHPCFIERLYDNLYRNNADLSVCSYAFVDENENQYNNIIFPNIKCSNKDFNNPFSSVVVWNKLYKSRIFKDIRFPIDKLAEDAYVYFRILESSDSIVSFSEVLYFYRSINKSSISNSQQLKFYNDAIIAHFIILKSLVENRFNNNHINNWINNLLLLYYFYHRTLKNRNCSCKMLRMTFYFNAIKNLKYVSCKNKLKLLFPSLYKKYKKL